LPDPGPPAIKIAFSFAGSCTPSNKNSLNVNMVTPYSDQLFIFVASEQQGCRSMQIGIPLLYLNKRKKDV
jgi:hypothetical protein